jgi:enediyne biosynthesis protein E4
VAFGDADGDGLLDMAIARQWDEPIFYRNDAPDPGSFLGLRLQHATDPGGHLAGSPVVGAQVRVTTAEGDTYLGRVDGGSGHAGKRSQQVHIGLGDATGPLSASITWRDRTGQVRQETLQLVPGWHDVHLGQRASVEEA